MHNEGYSSMCGHGIIAIIKVAIESGLVKIIEPKTTVRIDSPAGLITAHGHVNNSKVGKVSFQNVPSYVVALDSEIEIPELNMVKLNMILHLVVPIMLIFRHLTLG